MAQFPLLTYLRLKFFVLLLRLSNRFHIGPIISRDRLLAERRYPTVQRTRIKIPSRDHGRFIIADLYLPPPASPYSSTTAKSSTHSLPVLLNYHGSGFVLDLLGTNVLACTQLTSELGIAVLDADYRKAPEHPFPAALQDIEDLLQWLGCSPSFSDLGVSLDPSRVVLSGYSAGANLALVASSALLRKNQREQQLVKGITEDTLGRVNIRGVVAVYPLLDLTAPPSTRGGKGWSAPTILLDLFLNSYIPKAQDRHQSSITPETLAKFQFPNTVGIVTCEKDILAIEGLALARRLEGSGSAIATATTDTDDGDPKGTNVVRSVHLGGVNHGFDAGAKMGTLAWERREEMHAMMVGTVRLALGLGS